METMRLLKFWGYRGAMTVGNRTILPRGSVVDMENALFEAADQKTDNKCTFKIKDADHNVRYITFTDFVCIIGDAVEERDSGCLTNTYDNVLVLQLI